jgi:hypothetical protein
MTAGVQYRSRSLFAGHQIRLRTRHRVGPTIAIKNAGTGKERKNGGHLFLTNSDGMKKGGSAGGQKRSLLMHVKENR